MNPVALQNGVFLDRATLDHGDLDLQALEASVPYWQWHAYTEAQDIPSRVAGAEVVVTNKCSLGQAVLGQAALDPMTPGRPDALKLIVVAATGTDNIDLDAARSRAITVCNIRDYATEAVAQHTVTLMLNLLTGIPWYWQAVREGAWSRSRQFCLSERPIRQARGLNFGIVGYGVLGQRVGALAQCLGMNLLIAERRGKKPRPGRLPFDEVVAAADVLSLHCPLTGETRALIDCDVLRTMKSDAVLINTARGGIVVEQELAEALRSGVIAGAAVDTLSQEPPPVDHVLLATDIPNLIVTPHTAWASQAARQSAVAQIAAVITAFAAGRPINTL